MISFPILVRRTHLYLGLLCLPWFIMYGVTSLAFSHNEWFNNEGIVWTEEKTWPCTLLVPEDSVVPREVGAQLLEIAGLEIKAFGVYRGGANQINVYLPEFWNARQLIYKIDKQQLALVTRPVPLNHMLSGMHARAGYQHDSVQNDAWALMVDLTAISFLLWVASGLYIWWKTPKMRTWGAIALSAGVLSFLLFMLLL